MTIPFSYMHIPVSISLGSTLPSLFARKSTLYPTLELELELESNLITRLLRRVYHPPTSQILISDLTNSRLCSAGHAPQYPRSSIVDLMLEVHALRRALIWCWDNASGRRT